MSRFNLQQQNLLYEDVLNHITQYINTQQILPGDSFPPERELTKKWNVSRNVLREAFHILESRGVIVSYQGKGRFLRQLPNNYTSTGNNENLSVALERNSLMEIFDVRKVLEMKTMELVVKNCTDEDIADIEDAINIAFNKFSESGNTVGELDLHRLYSRKSKNSFINQLLEMIYNITIDLMHGDFLQVYLDHDVSETITDHKNILKAIKERDVEASKNFMAEHIQHTIDMIYTH